MPVKTIKIPYQDHPKIALEVSHAEYEQYQQSMYDDIPIHAFGRVWKVFETMSGGGVYSVTFVCERIQNVKSPIYTPLETDLG